MPLIKLLDFQVFSIALFHHFLTPGSSSSFHSTPTSCSLIMQIFFALQSQAFIILFLTLHGMYTSHHRVFDAKTQKSQLIAISGISASLVLWFVARDLRSRDWQSEFEREMSCNSFGEVFHFFLDWSVLLWLCLPSSITSRLSGNYQSFLQSRECRRAQMKQFASKRGDDDESTWPLLCSPSYQILLLLLTFDRIWSIRFWWESSCQAPPRQVGSSSRIHAELAGVIPGSPYRPKQKAIKGWRFSSAFSLFPHLTLNIKMVSSSSIAISASALACAIALSSVNAAPMEKRSNPKRGVAWNYLENVSADIFSAQSSWTYSYERE